MKIFKLLIAVIILFVVAGCATTQYKKSLKFRITKIVLCEYMPEGLNNYVPALTSEYKMSDNVILYIEFTGFATIIKGDIKEAQIIENITFSNSKGVIDSGELFNGPIPFPIDMDIDPGWAWAVFPILMAYAPGEDYKVTINFIRIQT